MRYPTAAALAVLLALPLFACDVTIDFDAGPDPDAVSAADRLAEPAPDVDLWTRRSDVVLFDEALELDVRLALRDDGTYRLVTEIVERGELQRSTAEGRYRWEGERLVLADASGKTTTLRRRGDDLQLETDWPADVVLAVTGLPDPTLRRAR